MKKMDDSVLHGKRVFLGLDGFVDEVLHVVKKRIDENTFEREKYMEDYGKRILNAAGLSMNVEMVPVRRKIGGNGVILANSLKQHGIDVVYLGTCGKEKLHAVFEEFGRGIRVISVGEPAYTDAIEFKNGKVISSRLENLDTVRWDTIMRFVSAAELAEIISQSDLCGFENWTMLMHMTDIWQHLLSDVLPNVEPDPSRILFIDLADPAKRSKEDIIYALGLLKKFEGYFRVNLGLNKREAMMIADDIGISGSDNFDEGILADAIRRKLEISSVVIHAANAAWAAEENCVVSQECPICNNPHQTTGAGDNFNAGFIIGRLLEENLESCLKYAIGNAGFYVRNARSANHHELCSFLKAWDAGRL